jgi:arginase
VRNLNVLGTLLGRLHQSVYDIIKSQEAELLLTVGGDHSIGSATISGVKKHYQDLRVVWVDAHPDCTNSDMRNP